MVNSLSVLIVDDNDDDALLMAYAFGEAGVDLRWSHVDTRQALVDALQRECWDVVLCDCRMPQLTMPTALLLARAIAPLTPVVLVSGEPPEEIEEVLATNAVDAVLHKDRLEDLPALVCGLLGRGHDVAPDPLDIRHSVGRSARA
jgi:CheY-like chemotaxis protein